MSPLEMQPTFSMDFPLPSKELMGRVRHAIASLGASTRAVTAGTCVEIAPPKDETRFWSPHLSVQISDVPESGHDHVSSALVSSEDSPAGRSQLFGRFSPRPEIWTFCMFLYFALGLLFCGGLLVVYVQWSLGRAISAVWALPIAILGILGLHIASWIGQGLSKHQMIELREQLDQILELAVPSSPTGKRPGLSSEVQTSTMQSEMTR